MRFVFFVFFVLRVLCGSALAGSAILLPASPRPRRLHRLRRAPFKGSSSRAGTVEALARAVVELRGDDDRMPALVSTTTEADGRFCVSERARRALSARGHSARVCEPPDQHHRHGRANRRCGRRHDGDRRDRRTRLRAKRRAARQRRGGRAQVLVSERAARAHGRAIGADQRSRRVPALLARTGQIRRPSHTSSSRDRSDGDARTGEDGRRLPDRHGIGRRGTERDSSRSEAPAIRCCSTRLVRASTR